MLKIDFTAEQIEALKHERFHHPHPFVRCKMETLLLKSQNLPHALIAKLVDISQNTMLSYFREFQAGGVDALKQLRFRRPVSKLESFRSSLEAHFREHPVLSLKQAKAEIAELTGISLSIPQIRKFLLKIGLKCRQVGSVPAKADLAKQAEFLEQELRPRLDEAQQGARQIFLSTPPTSSSRHSSAGSGR